MMRVPKILKTLLRLAVTVGAVAFALSQVDMAKAWPMLRQQSLWYLAVTVMVIQSTQFIGALRMRYYLRKHGVALSVARALRLHYVGELYSAILPGGAAGDVYKAWWLKRYQSGGLLNMAKVMVGARLNGLWALGAVACVLLLCSPLPRLVPHGYVLSAAVLVAGTVGYALFARLVLGETWREQGVAAVLYSLPIQLLVALSAFMVCYGLGAKEQAGVYVMLYLVSNVVALLPVSIGGIGVRELTLLHGSQLLLLDEEQGVVIALTLTFIGMTVPLVGAVLQIGTRSHRQLVEEAAAREAQGADAGAGCRN